jgi:hypothetical protein
LDGGFGTSSAVILHTAFQTVPAAVVFPEVLMKCFSLVFSSVLLLISSTLISGTSQRDVALAKMGQQKPSLSPDDVIRKFTEKESELRDQWKEFTYQQETIFQVLGPANTVSGEFYQLSEFVFNDAGQRNERILKAPQSTLHYTGLEMTAEDRNQLVNLNPFALTTQDLPNYTLKYIGKEKVDDLNTYVFDVIPRILSDQRAMDRARKQKIEGNYFQGRIWVDDEDLQVVKSAGKAVPEFKQRFPKFETLRENIEGRYWFPTYTYGDDELVFDRGGSAHVRLVVRYKNYRRFSSKVRLIDTPDDEPEASTDKEAKPADKIKTPEKKIKNQIP